MLHRDEPLIIVSLVLQLIVITFLLQGAFRKYPLVLAYSLVRLIATVVEVFLRTHLGETVFFRQVYYSDRVTLNLVLFAMVTAIIYKLVETQSHRSMIGKALVGIVAGVLLLPFLVLSRPFSIRWLNGMSQFLYFGSGIVTLALWSVLISSKQRDSKLLKFTVGLGIAMAGAALSFGLQRWMRSPRLVWMPNLFLQLTHVTGLLVWCWAFWPVKQRTSTPAALIPR
jgi:hypothetical protein